VERQAEFCADARLAYRMTAAYSGWKDARFFTYPNSTQAEEQMGAIRRSEEGLR
jgi:hypothetical protein